MFLKKQRYVFFDVSDMFIQWVGRLFLTIIMHNVWIACDFFILRKFMLQYINNKIMGKIELLLLMLLSFLFISCDKEVDPGKVIIEHMITVALVDKEGNELLNVENENAYDPAKIRIYKVQDGKETLYADGTQDLVFGVNFLGEDVATGHYYTNLIVVYTDIIQDNHSTVIVKWNEQVADTVVCEVDPSWYDNIRKVYINGELLWDRNKSKDGPIFTLVK